MDQSDLMFVRSTLDAVVAGNANVEDAVTALEMIEDDIIVRDVVEVPTGTDVTVYEGEGSTNGDEIPF